MSQLQLTHVSDQTGIDSVHISMLAVKNLMETLHDSEDKESLKRVYSSLSLKYTRMKESTVKDEPTTMKEEPKAVWKDKTPKEAVRKTVAKKRKVANSTEAKKQKKCGQCGAMNCDWGGSPCWMWDA